MGAWLLLHRWRILFDQPEYQRSTSGKLLPVRELEEEAYPLKTC
jgi:hypothetical protein